MKQTQEVVQIALEERPSDKQQAQAAKLAVRIQQESGDVLIYNGASNYLVQTVMRELRLHVS